MVAEGFSVWPNLPSQTASMLALITLFQQDQAFFFSAFFCRPLP